MIRIEYQLSHDDFREGMNALRKHVVKLARAQKSKWQLPIFISALISLSLFWGLVWPRLTGTYNRSSYNPQPVAEIMTPHLYWLSALIMLIVLFVWLARYQFRRRMEHLWESMPQLHQRKTVEFDEAAMKLSDRLVDTRQSWMVYRHFEETKNLFLLYPSDYQVEMYPKRAFSESTLAEFRTLAARKAGERRGAFEVLPAAGAAS